MQKVKYYAKSIFVAILVGFILALGVGYLLGFKPFFVIGASSEPFIKRFSVIIDYKPPFEDLKIGDYVTFSVSGMANTTHKIIALDIENDNITTQGNPTSETNNPATENFSYAELKGRVVYRLYYTGLVVKFVQENTLQVLMAVGVAIISVMLIKSKPDYELNYVEE